MNNNIFTQSDEFKNEYCCSIVRIDKLTPIESSDFLAKTDIFGVQIVVRKDQVKEGDIMIYAANETQLSEKFLSVNNLFEIGCRNMNANADEVNAIMKPYLDVMPQIDKRRGDAKTVKSKIDNMTKKSSRLNKDIKKMKEKLSKYEENSDDYIKLTNDIAEKQDMADKCYKIALENTTAYTNIKSEIEKMVKEGEPFVAQAKKLCGFFNKYGRVRCITLKGEPSFGFLFTANELKRYCNDITDEDIINNVGKDFDTINGDIFVKAYIPPVKPDNTNQGNSKSKHQNSIKKFDRMIDGEFFFHYDTKKFGNEINVMNPDDDVTISVKVHGTSGCFAKVHVKEKIKLPFMKNLFNKFVDYTGLFKKHRITDYKVVYGPVYSSRTVIKNRYINDKVGTGFYKVDVWSEWGDIIYPYLEDGMTVYGEIFGYLTGTETAIQKFYDYGCNKGENKFMPYRITTTSPDGSKYEWNVSEVKEWTDKLIERMTMDGNVNKDRIHQIDILYKGTLADLYSDLNTDSHWHTNLLERMKNDKDNFGMELNEPLCTFNKVPREGIMIRINNDKFVRAFKLKTQSFMLKEAVSIDAGEIDIEMMDNYCKQGEDN